MDPRIVPLLIGALFGGGLVLSGLADPDKIVGSLRLRDFHAMRTIAVFVLVGMLGTYVLSLLDLANFEVKPATLLTAGVGGALLGLGLGMTGYCPGTGLACAVSGRFDALVTVLGMFGGAAVFIAIQPAIVAPLDKIADYGKVTLPQYSVFVPSLTETNPAWWVIPIVVIGAIVLLLTRPRGRAA